MVSTIWNLDRKPCHPLASRPRMLLTSGSTLIAAVWQRIGPYLNSMEINFIDYEGCRPVRRCGLRLVVVERVRMDQQFGERHPNHLAYRLGLQLYSPFRRAVAHKPAQVAQRLGHVPLDIRLKECMNMLPKPRCWLALEAARRSTARSLRAGMTAPLGEPFPREFPGRAN